MSKVIIVADNAANAVRRAESVGLTRDDITIVTNAEYIYGYRDMLVLYAGEAWTLPDFDKIMDYMTSHDIKALKLNDPTKDTEVKL